jgi:seryl-tRNA synthetase
LDPILHAQQVYSVRDSSLCLTGTAEVPLGGIYMDQILSESQLPIRMVAYGHCFRTEAGAAGQASKGLYRVHQFSKVESSCTEMIRIRLVSSDIRIRYLDSV